MSLAYVGGVWRHVRLSGNERISAALVRDMGGAMPHHRIETLFRLGAIYNVTEKARVWEDATPPARSVLRVHVHPKRFPVERVDWRRAIVDETSDFVVVNKPRGVPVHPTVDNGVENVLTQLQRIGVPALLTHRLDVSTSGLMVFAKTPAFQSYFNTGLGARGVEKLYRALVDDAAAPARLGLLRHWMLAASQRDPPPRSVRRTDPHDARWVEALTEVVSRLPALSAVSSDGHVAYPPPAAPARRLWLTKLHVRLLTGRTHQIRASLGAEGHPLYGDVLYGFPNPHHAPRTDLRSLPLKAVHLAFREARAAHLRRYTLPDADEDHAAEA